MALDLLSIVHLGRLRTGPPATGAQPQFDNLLRVHIGIVADASGAFGGLERIDEAFCIATGTEARFRIVTERDGVFCVAAIADERFAVATEHDQNFCIVTRDEAEVEL